MATLADIEGFLAHKRIAVVGVSRNPRDFTRLLYKEFRRRGYELIPVHPGAKEIDGDVCFARLQDVQPPVQAALLFTPPAITEVVSHDCAESGIQHLWMHRGGGRGAVHEGAVSFCRERGISVVDGECPFMFLPRSGGIHRFHAFVKKLFRTYPQANHGCDRVTR